MKRDILDHMWLFTSKRFLFVLLLGIKRFHFEINQQAAEYFKRQRRVTLKKKPLFISSFYLSTKTAGHKKRALITYFLTLFRANMVYTSIVSREISFPRSFINDGNGFELKNIQI